MPVYLVLDLYLIGGPRKFLKREKTSRVSFGGKIHQRKFGIIGSVKGSAMSKTGERRTQNAANV